MNKLMKTTSKTNFVLFIMAFSIFISFLSQLSMPGMKVMLSDFLNLATNSSLKRPKQVYNHQNRHNQSLYKIPKAKKHEKYIVPDAKSNTIGKTERHVSHDCYIFMSEKTHKICY